MRRKIKIRKREIDYIVQQPIKLLHWQKRNFFIHKAVTRYSQGSSTFSKRIRNPTK